MHKDSEVSGRQSVCGQEGAEADREGTNRQKHKTHEMENWQSGPRRRTVASLLPCEIHADLYRDTYGGC